jgi:hypothetical protein
MFAHSRKTAMKKTSRFVLALVSGMGAAASVFSSPNFHHRASASDLSRMRGDVERVGATMRMVLKRESTRQNASAKQQ